jgi:hypothetical protein
MNAISKVSVRIISDAPTDVHPLKTIALLCGLGLVASLCMASFGLDMGFGFF